MATFPKSPRFPLLRHSTPVRSCHYRKKSQIPRRVHTPIANTILTRSPTPYHRSESFSSILNDDNEPPLTLDDLKDQSTLNALEKRKEFKRADLIELIGLLEAKVKGLEVAYQAAREEIQFYKRILERNE